MTTPTAPTPITAAPTVPDRADRSTFPARMYAFFSYLAGSFLSGANALATNIYDNALMAYSYATSSATDASVASAAVTAMNAIAWVSGTTYAIGDARYSPANLQTYRRVTAGAGTTDPSADATNWTRVALSGLSPVSHLYSANPTGTFSRAASVVGAAYSRTLTTVTVTENAHTRQVGDYLYLDFTTGTAVDGWFTITGKTANDWTVTHGTSGATSGLVTIYPPVIITVTSQAAHLLSTGDTTYVDFSGTFTDSNFTVAQVVGATFQIKGDTGNPTTFTTLGANTSGTVTLNSIAYTTTWTKPAGLVYAKVTAVGGGGGYLASGGGTSIKTILAASLGATETVTVGRGGQIVTAASTGGTTSFGAHCSATGGISNSVGGTGTGGDINMAGGPPSDGDGVTPNLGNGGPSSLGQGGSAAASPHNAPQGYGGGGGAGSAVNLGAGARGVVIVEEFY